MKHSFKRVLACLIAVLMITSVMPFSSLAADVDVADIALTDASANFGDAGLTVITDKESNLAPGISMNEVAVYDKNGNRVEMFIATADTTVDTVKIQANYMDNQNDVYGMQKTTEQVAAAEANNEEPYNVVAAINASYYNTHNGKPTGAFVMRGNDVTVESEGNNYAFFAVLKDGTHMIGAKGEYSKYKGQIEEAIGGYIHIVKDGAVVSGLDQNTKYPRQTIGITEDGKVIVMTADGNQAPKSDGLTVQEQAEVMLAMGCVEALHLDGGGSATYCAKREGTDEFKVLNSPSNGSERAVSNTLMFVSTAIADGTFDHATLTADNTYVTPNSSVNVSAIGVDAAGGVAEIPENVVWQLEDESFGTVENGVFKSTGKTGEAVVQLALDGAVVGEVSINVVNPTAISFGKEQMVVPFGETVKLKLSATVGATDIVYNESDFTVTLADANAGAVEGLTLTAPDASTGITGTNLTVTLKADESITTTIKVVYGKGSEVIFDFEKDTPSADTNNWVLRTHESKPDWNEQGEIYVVNSETGRVRSGEQALAFRTDFSQTTCSGGNTTGYHALSIGWNGDAVSVKGAQSIGFWIYIPEDAMSTEVTLNAWYTDSNGVIQRRTKDAFDDNGEMIYTPYWSEKMEGSGWHYVKADFSKFADDLFIHDEPGYTGGAYKRNFFIKLYAVTGPDTLNFSGHHGDFTYYIDDITVDYSDATADRELPVFSSATVSGGTSSKDLAYGTVAQFAEDNAILNAVVADNTNKDNYSGIDASTAKVYVDGVDVGAKYSNGMISSENVKLANGYHKVRFEIADNNGNVGYMIREFNVAHATDMKTVELVPHDATLDRLLSGSVYWVDLTSEDIATLEKVETTLNLNSINSFVLDQMDVNAGFDVTYTSTACQDVEDIVELTFTRNDEELDKDSNVIASIPVKVWEPLLHTYAGHTAKTPEYMWKNGNIQFKQVNLTVDKGVATFADAKTTFSGDINVDHEGYTHHYNMDQDYWEATGTYHVHDAKTIESKDATCTKPGYTGRTFCEACNSVVEWGKTIPATGHNYVVGEDGILDCEDCGKKYTGIFEGKYYIDGISPSGWVEESYYVDGIKLTGVKEATAPDSEEKYYYDFGDDGVCKNKVKFTGLFLDETEGVYRYSKMGVLSSGWIMIENDWYLFDSETFAAVTGDYKYNSFVTYEFENTGKLKSGEWYTTLTGSQYYYGPDKYLGGWRVIDGKTYYFEDYYRLEGIQAIYESNVVAPKWCKFDKNGVFIDDMGTGLMEIKGEMYYLIDGLAQRGMYEIDGDIYYFNSQYHPVTGSYYTTATNGVLPVGTYEFGPDGKMKNGLVEENGGLYYYETGKKVKAGLKEIDGAYYYINSSAKAVTGDYYVTNTNGIVEEGTYYFAPDGKMGKRNGVLEENGQLYYYKDGVKARGGLVEYNGDIYYFNSKGVAVTGTYYVTKTNGLLTEGNRDFDENGKMKDGLVNENGGTYYYEDGRKVRAGLKEIDGAYYYINSSCKVIKDCTYYVTNTNGIVPEGERIFDADGKMKNGLIDENGALYYYEMGRKVRAGLKEIDGALYYINSSCKAVTGDYFITNTNGILPMNTYTFAENGKLKDGFVEENGATYYYEVGKKVAAGLIEVDGDYYYINSSAKVVVGRYYVTKTNGLTPEGNYDFDLSGKLVPYNK